MQKRTYSIIGMSCAACVANVERAVKRLQGVSDVNVMLLKNAMTLYVDETKVPDGVIEAAVKNAGYEALLNVKGAGPNTADDGEERRQKRSLIICIVLTVIMMAISMSGMLNLGFAPKALHCAVAELVLALAVMILQRKYFKSAFNGIRHFNFNMDTLIALGSGAAFLSSLHSMAYLSPQMGAEVLKTQYPLFFESTAGILTFVSIGKFLEQRAKVKTRNAVNALSSLAPKFVLLCTEDGDKQVLLEEVKVGDILKIRAGEQIGVDGSVIEGSGHTDESAITGESRPIKKHSGSKVTSATLLLDGSITIKAEQVGSDTTLSKIIDLVDEASGKKAPIARLADIIASYFVPAVITLAAITFIAWYFAFDAGFDKALSFAISVLVVSCPCALGLATPVAITAGSGRAASKGILFKSPEAIENLSRSSVFVFDKTGTLTYGNMAVTDTYVSNKDDLDRTLLLSASLESKSAHPLAGAIVKKAMSSQLLDVKDYALKEGLGIEGLIDGKRYGIGNEDFALNFGAKFDLEAREFIKDRQRQGLTVLALYAENQALALFAIGDEIRPESVALIKKLKALNLKSVMLTGDRLATAESVAAKVGIDEVKAELKPEDKSVIIGKYQQQGSKVVMVGDGINDAVALTQADTGIGLAGTADIAVSSCDVVLLKENIFDVFNAYLLSSKTVRNIKENLFWAFIYNIVCIPVACGLFYSSFGLFLTPLLGAALMSLSSVCVVCNALRLTAVKTESADIQNESNALKEVLMKKEICVEGMQCSHCKASVEKALKTLPGVSDVKVSLKEKKAWVSANGEVSDNMLKQAVEHAGFDVKDIKSC